MSDKPKLSEIRAREQAATEGPWEIEIGEYGNGIYSVPLSEPEDKGESRTKSFVVITDNGSYPPDVPTEEFIAHSRTDIPHLLKLVESLGEALLRFADGPFCGYCSITFENNGSITHEDKCPVPQARALLKELEL